MTEQSLKFELADDDLLYFLHLAKSAGTTFYSILKTQFQPEEIAPFTDEEIAAHRLHNPSAILDVNPYRLMRSHFDYNIHTILSKKPVYVTFLRNPVERVISLYYFVRRQPDHFMHTNAINTSLEDFLEYPGGYYQGRNFQTRQIAGFTDTRYEGANPLSNPELLNIAKRHLAEFPFFGLAERFEDSLKLLSYTFGWLPVIQYESLNVSPDKDRHQAIPQSTIEKIKEANRLDILLYEYAQRLFEERMQQMEQERHLDVMNAHKVKINQLLAQINSKLNNQSIYDESGVSGSFTPKRSMITVVNEARLKPIKALHYYQFYDELFAKLQDKPLNVVKVGVFEGGSILMFANYFPNAHILGIDSNEPPQRFYEEYEAQGLQDRVQIRLGSQGDTTFLKEAITSFFAGQELDIVIDDGSHFYDLSKITFDYIFYNHLKRGGYYIIEDWETGYWPKWYDGNPDGMHGLPKLIKELVDLTALNARTAVYEGVRALPAEKQMPSPIKRILINAGLVATIKA
jgi:cephalosporin hydroxylase